MNYHSLDDVAPAASWLKQVHANARATVLTLLRAPRHTRPRRDRRRLVMLAAAATVAVAASMLVVDRWSLDHVRELPIGVAEFFDRFTDFGRASLFLWPIGLVLIGLAMIDMPAAPRFARLVLAAWAVRLGFFFTALAVPGVFVAVAKRLIGRARPLVDGGGVWIYRPFNLHADHASLPSGHATTAFAAAVAIGALFPEARAVMWIYAALMAVSRIAVEAHHPSDIVVGAAIGFVGAVAVRDWFAARGLGFTVMADGAVRPKPGPGLRRIVGAIGRCLSALCMTTARAARP